MRRKTKIWVGAILLVVATLFAAEWLTPNLAICTIAIRAVHVRVMDRDTGQPIPHAKVIYKRPDIRSDSEGVPKAIKIGYTLNEQTAGVDGVCHTVWDFGAGGTSTLLFGRPNYYKIKNNVRVLADGYAPYEAPLATILGEVQHSIHDINPINIEILLERE